ncbi:MAG: rod shape-determining protein RodA [Candidatus Eisenbacteria bacterium]|nr:rod shape-determining protein RodA [Candidatus Eisenbacteria bacterium]
MLPRWILRWDWGLTAGFVVLWAAGLVFLGSAMRPLGEAGHQLLLRQLLANGIGLGVLLAAALLPPRFLEQWSYALFLVMLLALLAVLLRGETAHGAQRWLTVAGVRFQPSEPAKISLIMVLAWFLGRRRQRWDRIWPWLQALVIIAVPTAMILRQPDLGTASTFPLIGIGMLVLAGLPALLLFFLISPLVTAVLTLVWSFAIPPLAAGWAALSAFLLARRGVNLVVVAVYFVAILGVAVSAQEAYDHLEPYQQARLKAFMDPEKDPQGAGYQVRQSKIAIGSGQWTGWGLGEGPMKKLLYLPRQHTDFIFSVVGEEGGFAATSIITLVFALIVLRGFQITRRARHPFIAMTAAGTTLFFFVHTVINMGITVGLLPVTGLPLPFFSFGGSYSITCMAAAGLLLGASFRWREY